MLKLWRYSVLFTTYTVQCRPYSVHRTVYTVHLNYTAYNIYWGLNSVKCTPYAVHYIEYILHCRMLQFDLYGVEIGSRCKPDVTYSVHCLMVLNSITLYILQCTHCTLCTVRRIVFERFVTTAVYEVYGLQCTAYIVHTNILCFVLWFV